MAFKGVEATLEFKLKIKNGGPEIITQGPGDIAYAVKFYFSDANTADQGAATKVLLTNVATPAIMNDDLAVNGETAVKTFSAKGTLPAVSCNSYKYFCACVEKGINAAYTESPTNNNCQCVDAGTPNLISCSPGMYSLLVFRNWWSNRSAALSAVVTAPPYHGLLPVSILTSVHVGSVC